MIAMSNYVELSKRKAVRTVAWLGVCAGLGMGFLCVAWMLK